MFSCNGPEDETPLSFLNKIGGGLNTLILSYSIHIVRDDCVMAYSCASVRLKIPILPSTASYKSFAPHAVGLLHEDPTSGAADGTHTK